MRGMTRFLRSRKEKIELALGCQNIILNMKRVPAHKVDAPRLVFLSSYEEPPILFADRVGFFCSFSTFDISEQGKQKHSAGKE